MRAGELTAGASSSRTVEIAGGTVEIAGDSAVVAEDTTEGVQITEKSGFRGTGPTSLLIVGALHPRFASPTTLVFQFFYALGTIACLFCWGWGNWKVSARMKSK